MIFMATKVLWSQNHRILSCGHKILWSHDKILWLLWLLRGSEIYENHPNLTQFYGHKNHKNHKSFMNHKIFMIYDHKTIKVTKATKP